VGLSACSKDGDFERFLQASSAHTLWVSTVHGTYCFADRSPPTLISSVLAGESTSRSVHGAKLAVWLLGHAERAKEGNGHAQEMQTDASHENGEDTYLTTSPGACAMQYMANRRARIWSLLQSISDPACPMSAGKPVGKGFAAVEAELQAAAEHGYYGDSALTALAKTGDLIEQYLHPSNNGQ